jgi:hypothetical protein
MSDHEILLPREEYQYPKSSSSLSSSSCCWVLLGITIGSICILLTSLYISQFIDTSISLDSIFIHYEPEVTLIPLDDFKDPIVLARILHLITVENMEEVHEFIDFLPSITSDVVFNCWNDITCHDPRPLISPIVYVSNWNSHRNYRINIKGQIQSFDRKKDTLITINEQEGVQLGFWPIQPSIYFINELSLNLSHRTTLTESRNRLAAFVSEQERIQGWKWAYVNIQDGDGHMECPLLNHIPQDTSWIIQFNRWNMLIQQPHSEEAKCWLAFNSFLLTIGPGVGLPVFFDRRDEWINGMMTFHFDGVIGAYHHQLFPIFHPLCEKFDDWTPWSSQGYLIIQGVCFIGHVFTNSYFHALNADHRPYQHNAPFAPFTDVVIRELNIFPERYQYMLNYLRQGDMYRPHIMPILSFDFYSGFDLDKMIPKDCITHMLDPKTCIKTSS